MRQGPSRTSGPIDERDFHGWLARHLRAGRRGLLPLGDDAAAVRPPHGQVAVLTTDSLVEGVHFLPDSRPDRVGAAAVAVSLSDLASKGAVPAGLLLALLVPPGTPAAWAERLVVGGERFARRFGTGIIGGDTKPGPVRAVVSTALGWGDPGRLAPRTRAAVGDVIVLTGVVGRGGLAAAHLGGPGRARSATLADLLDVQPRVAEGRALSRWAHAMLDTSDGLAESARLLADASRVAVVVEESRLPLAPGVARLGRTVERRRAIAFFGGDYELLAALPPSDVGRARTRVTSAGGSLTVVGRVERGRGTRLETGAGWIPMPPSGWRPFDGKRRALP